MKSYLKAERFYNFIIFQLLSLGFQPTNKESFVLFHVCRNESEVSSRLVPAAFVKRSREIILVGSGSNWLWSRHAPSQWPFLLQSASYACNHHQSLFQLQNQGPAMFSGDALLSKQHTEGPLSLYNLWDSSPSSSERRFAGKKGRGRYSMAIWKFISKYAPVLVFFALNDNDFMDLHSNSSKLSWKLNAAGVVLAMTGIESRRGPGRWSLDRTDVQSANAASLWWFSLSLLPTDSFNNKKISN